MAPRPRLLVCDDAPGFQVLARSVFREGGFDVVGVAGTWADAERLAGQLAPDAILLELWLPTFDRDGVARVRAAHPTAALAVVSSLAATEAAELVSGVAGIDVILSKRERPELMVAALRARLNTAGQGFEPR